MLSPGSNSPQIILHLSVESVNLHLHRARNFARCGSFRPQHDDPIHLAEQVDEVAKAVDLSSGVVASVGIIGYVREGLLW